MRWEELFADLGAEFEALEAADLAAEVTDRTRRELARIRLEDRLRAAPGAAVWVLLGAADGGQAVRGRLLDSGPDWLLVGRGESGVETLIPLAAVSALTGLPAGASEPGSEGHVRST